MSEPRTVKVAEVEVKTGGEEGKRPWTKYTLVDGNGDKASTFDGKVGKFLQDHIGKQIDITTEQAGKFTNLLTATEHIEASKTSGNGYYQRDPESELRIAREASLHAVTRLYAGSGKDFGEVIRLADRAVRWIYSGEVAVAASVPTQERSPASAPSSSAPRGELVRQAILAFNHGNGRAQEWVKAKGLSLTLTDWSESQLREFIDQFREAVPA